MHVPSSYEPGMSRTEATAIAQKAVLAMLAVAVIVAVALIDYSGCAVADLGTDLGEVEARCLPPSVCYTTGTDCNCRRLDADLGVAVAAANVCLACNPAVQECICSSDQKCRLANTQCVGRSPTLCPGTGARCLPARSDCSTTGGDPPQRVGTGQGGTLEPRCAYVDDVCCAGTIDADAGT